MPLVLGKEFGGAILASPGSALTRGSRWGLESLGAQVASALERIELTENLHRRRGVERFESLVRNADLAMYRAKSRGKARYEVFDAEMGTYALRRLERETNMRRAVDRGEFVVYYQPKVDLTTGALHGFEALVRWQHPERGLVPPAEFIPFAEESGLIVQIGKWVLE